MSLYSWGSLRQLELRCVNIYIYIYVLNSEHFEQHEHSIQMMETYIIRLLLNTHIYGCHVYDVYSDYRR